MRFSPVAQTCLPRVLLAGAVALLAGCATSRSIPHLEQRDGMTKLIVDDRPYICVAGEVTNTASSDPEAMKAVWPHLAQANFNTVLTVVSWDLVEPKEGMFDFSMIDYQIKAARANHMRLILLWMGSWKNGLSHFPPEWVKQDTVRFPRAINAAGKPLEILSAFSAASRDADARAFAAVMKHVREVDSVQHTVVAIQVENEVGVQGTTRDFGPGASKAYQQAVPAELMRYLVAHKETLDPAFRKVWMDAGGKTSGTWEEVFGKNVPRTDAPVPNNMERPLRPANFELFNHTDEIFMAWGYAQYMGRVAAEGKKQYPLPMFVNTWLVQPRDTGAGDYPSGGPEPFVHDVWHAGAPAVDILAPDIYLPAFEEIVRGFARHGNPAFVPETRPNSLNCWNAFTQYNVLCFSPFGIDNIPLDTPFTRTYGLVQSLSGAIAEAQGRPGAIKVLTAAPGKAPGRIEMGDYAFDFSILVPRGGAAATAPATAPASAPTPATRPGNERDAVDPGLEFMNGPYIVVVQTGRDEFYFATNSNFQFSASPLGPGSDIVGPVTADRGYFQAGRWIRVHRLNGDDLMRGGYDVSGAAEKRQSGTVVPLAAPRSDSTPSVVRVKLYRY